MFPKLPFFLKSILDPVKANESLLNNKNAEDMAKKDFWISRKNYFGPATNIFDQGDLLDFRWVIN